MARTSTSLTLRSTVKERAQGRCEYCHLPEEVGFARYEVDHIISEQHGGKTERENLAYACMVCNKEKALISLPLIRRPENGHGYTTLAPNNGMIIFSSTATELSLA